MSPGKSGRFACLFRHLFLQQGIRLTGGRLPGRFRFLVGEPPRRRQQFDNLFSGGFCRSDVAVEHRFGRVAGRALSFRKGLGQSIREAIGPGLLSRRPLGGVDGQASDRVGHLLLLGRRIQGGFVPPAGDVTSGLIGVVLHSLRKSRCLRQFHGVRRFGSARRAVLLRLSLGNLARGERQLLQAVGVAFQRIGQSFVDGVLRGSNQLELLAADLIQPGGGFADFVAQLHGGLAQFVRRLFCCCCGFSQRRPGQLARLLFGSRQFLGGGLRLLSRRVEFLRGVWSHRLDAFGDLASNLVDGRLFLGEFRGALF
ncbi:MAG: hypothetical protein IH939_13350 [Acidobacteria bacterium]|nr:hypothetical protein [Acidobacteriota bacterium]